jgi:hypothetical protein
MTNDPRGGETMPDFDLHGFFDDLDALDDGLGQSDEVEHDFNVLHFDGATMKTAQELAEAVREERMEFDDALLDLLMQNHLDHLDLSFFMKVKIAIGYAAMGNFEKHLPISKEELSVREIIDRFGLGPFVETQNA